MIRILADGALAYDSRLEEYDLESLQITTGVNVAGSATFTMPPGHPAYNKFVSLRTVVTIYRDEELRFRGRVLYPSDDYYGRRTITCEGELCFLGDGIQTPITYSMTAGFILRRLVENYNEQMQNYGYKQFAIGTIDRVFATQSPTVFSIDSAETHLSAINKLREQFGGFITFSDDPSTGARAINWVESISNQNNQQIDFEENLLNFSSTGANNTEFATTLIPYGATITDAEGSGTEKRVTIAEVNGGDNYVTNAAAKAIYGNIVATKTWDFITDAQELLNLANTVLDEMSVFVTSLTLSAMDLSQFDKSIDSFTVGDSVRVISKPHGVNKYFQITDMTENLLHPEKSSIVLGANTPTLTSAVLTSEKKAANRYATREALMQSANAAANTYATKTDLTTSENTAASTYATKAALTKSEQAAANTYATKTALTTSENTAATTYATKTQLNAEVSNRAGVINKVDGVVNISGGAPINMLGGKIDIDGSEINIKKEIRFPNTYGVRIADKDGNSYYVLRVDNANSCVVGNDYTNLYLRGKDAVYLYKTGAVVTSDQREKNSVERLPEAYTAMLDKLTPVRFRYNDRGDRYHVGFIAQDVAQAMTEAGLSPEDFGGFIDLNGDGSHLGLAYDEFIGLLLDKIRRLEKRIEKLEE